MKDRENLRSGFTTGACAAAASRGALLALIRQQTIGDVAIRLPGGQIVPFTLHHCSFSESDGQASVIKDAGDDPDVTHLAEICARVTWSASPGIAFERGVGVGLVTRKGLPVPPGEPAINPAPRKLIAEMIEETLAEQGLGGRGIVVEISVPRGEELARKTFNPRLGIVGGISILGTTGIVEPYSTAAWLASVTQEIDVAVAGGIKDLVLTVGARGERLARQVFTRPEGAFVQIGPFFADALRHCAQTGVEKATLAAMIGKLAKFAAGNESVHSTSSSQDFAFLAEAARASGASAGLVEQIMQANTSQEAAELVREEGLDGFFDAICRRAWNFADDLLHGTLTLDVCLTGQDGEVLGRCLAEDRAENTQTLKGCIMDAGPDVFTPAALSEAEREAIYKVMRERRDIRRFLPRAIPDDVLGRILEMAHLAPSVGFMQPWNFLLVSSLELRQQVKTFFEEANARELAHIESPARRELYATLKLEGILEAPLNIAVTCDGRRDAPFVLGRAPMPQTDLFSTCLAIQNLWLAARAEGVGVGWVSILDRPAMEELLGLPAGVQLVAYLCVGYPPEFPPRPMLEEVGWKRRAPLRDLVFQDRWGARCGLIE